MYTFKYGGKDGQEYHLVESRDLVVVRTDGPPLKELDVSEASRAFFPQLIPVASFPEAQVTVYRVIASDPDEALRLRNAVRRQLKTEKSIRFAGRVLKDKATGTVFVYTENIFVKFRDACTGASCRDLLQKYGLRIKEELVFSPNAFFVEPIELHGPEVFELAQRLLEEETVEACHPELVMEKQHKSAYPMQWHLRRTMIGGQTIDNHVRAEEAWALSRGEGVTIAVIDDAVDYEHPELGVPGKIVAPRDTVANLDDARPRYDGENHGTACAGVACAAGLGKASGVAPAARLLPIRSGGLGSVAEAKAFAWAADHGTDVISCSWGPRDGAWWNPGDPQHTRYFALPDSTRMAIDYAVRTGRDGKGCVIVWAAGNGNEDVRFDGYASYEKVMAVAACNDRGARSVYSDFGKAVWCCFPSNDFHVPRFNHPRPLTAGIWTTDRTGRNGYNAGGIDAEETLGDLAGEYTATFGGTSSACPGVAGVVALMLAVNPALNWQSVRDLVRRACVRIDPENGNYDFSGHSIYYGYGRLDARRAVELAGQGTAPVDAFGIAGMAVFNKGSVVEMEEGKLTGDAYAHNRLVGIRLRITPFHSEMGIRYRLNVNRLGFTAWSNDGGWSETRDKRRKVVGLQIELTGRLADRYTVEYRVQLRGSTSLQVGRDGEVAGTTAGHGKAIEEVAVAVFPKESFAP